jgi:hypothetical protein
VLTDHGIAISMDGKAAWRDNVFVERLWRSVKYKEVYLRAYDSVSEARASIGNYLNFYNGRRPLIDAEKLFRQPGPVLPTGCGTRSCSCAGNRRSRECVRAARGWALEP